MENDHEPVAVQLVRRIPWNKGKIVGAKPPLRPSHVWSIRTELQMKGHKRVAPSGYAMDRATIRQRKTGRPVRFELTDQTRPAIDEYLRLTGRKSGQVLFA